MSELRLLQAHELQAQRGWAEEEGRPEIIALFGHITLLERQLAEAQEHMGEAWLEYRRLWLRWLEQRIEYRYAKKRESEARAILGEKGA